MVVGILNTFAALARATTLFFSIWRSIDCTPNAICGWWSIKMICEFCGVRTSSFGLAMGDLQRRLFGVTRSLKDGSAVHCRDARTHIASCDAKILVRRNLMVWRAAIYCTLVVRDT